MIVTTFYIQTETTLKKGKISEKFYSQNLNNGINMVKERDKVRLNILRLILSFNIKRFLVIQIIKHIGFRLALYTDT